MLIVAAALALVVGLVLGTLGGGGAILTLPMLVYALHVEAKTAIATSLFVVGSMSLFGMTVHARAGNVRWKVGGSFGAAAMAGAFAGGRLARQVPGEILLVGFGVVMLVTAIAMLRGRHEPSAPPRKLAMGRALALGATVGIVSGLVGAGGGFLIVPALTVFGGLGMLEAIGTSLFVITLQSFAGFAGHVGEVELDWKLIIVVSIASVLGSIVGAFVGKKVSPSGLRRGFAWLVIAMGLFLIEEQVPLVVFAVVAPLTLGVVAFAVKRAPRPPDLVRGPRAPEAR